MITRTLVVGAAIVDDLRSPSVVLGARRTKPDSLRGRWEFPGGKVERDELPEDALRREVQEELSVDIELGVELTNPAGGNWPISEQYDMRVWFAVIQTGAARPTDSHDQLAWIGADIIASYDWLDADLPIVDEVVRIALNR